MYMSVWDHISVCLGSYTGNAIVADENQQKQDQ